MPRADRFLHACRNQSVDATPVWLMRQAGRYMPEYRALRATRPILELIKSPELAAEVTLQPLNAFAMDAGIIFADILQVHEELGLNLEFVSGVGPVIDNPVRDAAAIHALRRDPGRGGLDATCEAIRLVTQTLAGSVPLIGFCGAPFTLACYAIEGGSSRDYATARKLMAVDPAAWDVLMGKMVDVLIELLTNQVAAGAAAVQIFDSWAGQLGPGEYAARNLPWIQKIVQALQPLGVPIIYFSTGTAGLLSLVEDTGADVIGVDWRLNLADARAHFGPDKPVMGNLDPFALFAPEAEMKRRAAAVLDQTKGQTGHIFNLGHGVHKDTSPDQVRALVDYVHEYTATE